MSRRPAEVPRDTLELPLDARAALIDCLLDSLDAEVDPDAEKLWEGEILRRTREIDDGSVTLIPWSELRAQLACGSDDR